MKKFFVIVVLFALPLVAYLFFASGVNHFGRLPVLDSKVEPLTGFHTLDGGTYSFEDRISILSFPGKEPLDFITNAYHLAEKIYDPYAGFNDLYFISVIPEGARKEVDLLKQKLSKVVDMEKWLFIVGSEAEVRALFLSLGTDITLNSDLSTPNAFIIDKAVKLRGRKKDDDGNTLFGYDTGSIAVINNKMDDDVKVILAEYRLALKKYNKEN